MSIADKLITVAEKLPKVYHAGQLNVLANAESLNGSLSGEWVSTNDVIDIKHNVACSLSGLAEGPNIIDPAAFEPLSESQTADGCSVRVEDDRVNISGGVEQSCSAVYNVTLPKGGYTLRIAVVGSPSGFFAGLSANVSGINMSFIENEDTTGNVISLEGRFLIISSTNITISVPCPSQTGFSFNISLTTPADYSSVKVSRYGKNLLDYESDAGKNPSETVNGVYNAKFITNSKSAWYGYVNIDTLPNIFTVSTYVRCEDHGSAAAKNTSIRMYVYDESKTELQLLVGTYATDKNPRTSIVCDKSSLPDGAKYIKLNIRINSEGYVENSQIELGTTATAYEPYIEPTTYTANADGTVDGITSIAPNMTLLTDTEGVVINANYYKDPDIVISNIAQSVALSGGEG